MNLGPDILTHDSRSGQAILCPPFCRSLDFALRAGLRGA